MPIDPMAVRSGVSGTWKSTLGQRIPRTILDICGVKLSERQVLRGVLDDLCLSPVNKAIECELILSKSETGISFIDRVPHFSPITKSLF